MEYIATYHTDVGTRKETNQDSLAIKVVNTKEGNVAFAIVCDGMGGLAKGEVASKEVIEAFCTWFDDTLVDIWRGKSFAAWYDGICNPVVQGSVLYCACGRQPRV